MYIIESRQASAELRSQDEIDGILRRLVALDYTPTFRAGAAAILKATGISAQPCSTACANIVLQMFANPTSLARLSNIRGQGPVGEIFFREGAVIALQPIGRKLYAWEAREHQAPSQLSDFCSDIAAAAKSSIDGRRLRGMSFEWQAAPLPKRRRAPVGRNRPL